MSQATLPVSTNLASKVVSVRMDRVESNRPATNFPGISVDSNRFNGLVEKSGLGVEPLRLLSPLK